MAEEAKTTNEQEGIPAATEPIAGTAKAGPEPVRPEAGAVSQMPDPADFLGVQIYDAAPTHDDIEGKLAAMDNGSSIQRLYAFLKGAWRAFAPYLGAYGEIYGSAAKNLTLTNAGQQYLIGDGSGVGSNGISAGGVTPDQANWNITPVAGNYRVSLTISISVDRTCKLEFGAANGGTLLANVYGEAHIVTANKLHVFSVTGLAALTTSPITPEIKTDTAGAVCTFERINLHIQSV